MQFEIGKTYKIRHTRKGVFSFRVVNQCDEWVTGTIVDGKANAMMDYNEKFEGEDITVRKSFVTIIEEPAESAMDKLRRAASVAAALVAMVALSACGTTSAVSQMDLSRPIAKDEARIVIERDSSLLYFAAGSTVKVNGQKIATLGRGGSVAHDVKAGHVVLEASTPTAPGQFIVRFDAKPRQTYEFEVSPKSDALVLGSAFGLAGDAVNASISDTSGYFQLEMR